MRKATISLILSACPSVHMAQLTHWTDSLEIWYLIIFPKYLEKIQVWLQSDKNDGHFTWRRVHLCYLSEFFLELGIFPKKIVYKIEKNSVFINFPPFPPLRKWRMRTACWATKATDTTVYWRASQCYMYTYVHRQSCIQPTFFWEVDLVYHD